MSTEPEMSLADMLKLRKELDPDAPDMIVVRAAAPVEDDREGESDLHDEMERDAMIDTINVLHRERDQALEILKEALAQTGCDGDLCNYRWHERARSLIADAHGTDEVARSSSPTQDAKKETLELMAYIVERVRLERLDPKDHDWNRGYNEAVDDCARAASTDLVKVRIESALRLRGESVTQSQDEEAQARAISLPFPCGCQDAHEAKGVKAPQVTCETHRAIATALQQARSGDSARITTEMAHEEELMCREQDSFASGVNAAKRQIVDWLEHRCNYAPLCGNCTYCRVATFIASLPISPGESSGPEDSDKAG